MSAGNALLFAALHWGRAGKKFGARNIMTLAFVAMTATLFAAGFCGERFPLVAGFFLLGSALFRHRA